MSKTRSMFALVAALGGAGGATDGAERIDPQLHEARTRAGIDLRLARSEFEQRHPERALMALRHAWQALEYVPGGEAFLDLVALDEVAQLAKAGLARGDSELSAPRSMPRSSGWPADPPASD